MKTRIPGESTRSPKQTYTAGTLKARDEDPQAEKRADFYAQYGQESTLPAGHPCNANGMKCAEGEIPTHRVGTIKTERGYLVGRPIPI